MLLIVLNVYEKYILIIIPRIISTKIRSWFLIKASLEWCISKLTYSTARKTKTMLRPNATLELVNEQILAFFCKTSKYKI